MFRKYFNWLFGKSVQPEQEIAGDVEFIKVDPEAEVQPKPKKKRYYKKKKKPIQP